MYIDFKVTAWERMEIPDDLEEEVMKAITEGKITQANDLWAVVKDFDGDCNIIDETIEQMDILKNDYQSTIEVYTLSPREREAECIWENAPEIVE